MNIPRTPPRNRSRLFLLAALSAFSLQVFGPLALRAPAAIVADFTCNQFRSTLSTSSTYIMRDTGTYYKNPGKWTFEGMAFDNTGINVAAVYIDGEGVSGNAVFTGSNIAIFATGSTSNARRALQVRESAAAYIYGGIIRQDNPATASGAGSCVYLETNATLTGEDLLIDAAGSQVHAVTITSRMGNVLTLTRSTIQNSGSAAALNMSGNGVALLNSSTILTTGAIAPGVISIGGYARFTLDGGVIRTTGANSPGLWLGSGNHSSGFGAGFTQFEGALKNALVRSEQGAGVDVNIDLPNLVSRPTITNPQEGWAGNYSLTVVSSTISGSLGALRMTSSATNATAGLVSEIYTKVLMNLRDSALDGDVIVSSGARLALALDASKLDGALRLSGSAPVAELSLSGGSLTGGIVLSGGATLVLAAANSAITGGLAASDSASAALQLNSGATLDTAALGGQSKLQIVLGGGALGNVVINDRAAFTLISAGRSADFSGDVAINGGASWRVAGKIIHHGALTLSGSAPALTIIGARGDDLVLTRGLTGKGRLTVEGVSGDVLGKTEIRIVADQTNALAADTFLLAAPVELGLAAYNLENRPDGAYLVGGIGRGRMSSAAGAVFNTSALAAADYFSAFDPVLRHLGGLRDSWAGHADGDSGAFWIQMRFGDTDGAGAVPGLDFKQNTAGVSAGVDMRWGGGENPAFTAGLFADTTYVKRDFSGEADGDASGFGAGVYALWQKKNGLYAAATVRLDELKNTLDSRAAGNTLSAEYKVRDLGATIEAGWRLRDLLPAGWWLEPSLQAGYARLGGVTYDTASANTDNVMRMELDDGTAIHGRMQASAGGNLDEKWSVRGRLAAAYLDVSGGGISGGGVSDAKFMLDGWRGEAAAGLVRRVGAGGRLYLEFEYTKASDWSRPWSLNLGYACAW